MIRNIRSVTVICIIISLFSGSIFSESVFAGSNDFFSRENIITIAKGFASLYLLNKVNKLITEQNEPEPVFEQQIRTEKSSGISSGIDNKIIVIDAGHGGSDPGAIGKGGLREKDVTLDIALRLYQLLRAYTKARVYLTRDKDQYVSLQERSVMANSLGADAFISIHINAAENGIEKGIETYAHYNSPEEAWALAWYLQESLVKELGLLDRGLKADNFHVIRETKMKAVLLEVGFISDRTEEGLLKQPATREKAARAIYQGLLTYYDKG
ncbi:MAG: N-acetylmuramoyl-L-alanine amidase [Halanaerobiaceae bacterium]|nr:N-acetylmuramoyl-L-alanine amidase [Halanaerobiaceae bacterium]